MQIRYYILTAIVCIANTAMLGQSSTTTSLQEALLTVAEEHKISIAFDPSKVKNNKVKLPNQNWSLERKISSLLKGTELQFKIDDEQIFLFQTHHIYGYIQDAETGERLIGATIYLPSSGQYHVTNEYGYFTTKTIEDSLAIEVKYIGYADKTLTIKSEDMDRPTTIKLPRDNELEEVVITDALVSIDERAFIELKKGSNVLLFQNQASSAVGGEPDIFQAMLRQAGVTSGADGIGGIHVRAGRNDQNQILYDGVKLYHSSHAFGLYSTINSSTINQAQLHKSGATGAISGRLSSIMDIRIKDPELDRFSFSTQATTLASQAIVNIPIWKNKIGMQIAGRRTHVDPIIKHLTKENKLENEEDGFSNFYFYDYSLKMYAKIDKRQRLYLTIFGSSDRYDSKTSIYYEDYEDLFTLDESSSLDWSNKLASLRYNILLGNSTFANIQASSYLYEYHNDREETSLEIYFPEEPYYDRSLVGFASGITSHELRLDFQTNVDSYEAKYGAVLSSKEYQTGIFTLEERPEFEDHSQPLPTDYPLVDIPIGTFQTTDLTAYFSNKIRANRKLLFDGGVYLNYYKSENKPQSISIDTSYLSLYGYLKSTAIINKHLSIGATAGRYVQNEHLLTTGDNAYPSDIWLPSNTERPPETSTQVEVFAEYSTGGHRLKTAVYYKTQQGLVIYDTIAVLPSITILEADLLDQTLLANTRGMGLELDYSYSTENFSFQGTYSYGQADYVFEDDIGEYVYPFEYSIPHAASFRVNTKLSKKVRLLVDWYYSKGRTYTLYSTPGSYSPLEQDTDIQAIQVSNYNSNRLSSSHKLSLAVSTSANWGKIRSDFYIGIQNVYNRKNVLYTYYREGVGLQSQTGFPILPMFRWRLSI